MHDGAKFQESGAEEGPDATITIKVYATDRAQGDFRIDVHSDRLSPRKAAIVLGCALRLAQDRQRSALD